VVWAGAGMETANIHTYHIDSAGGVISAAPAGAVFALPLPTEDSPGSPGEETAEGRALPVLRWLAPHPLFGRLYAAVNRGAGDGEIMAVEVEPATGVPVRSLGQAQSTRGTGVCHISVTDRFVLVAHYSGGSVAVLPILADGSVGPAVCLRHHGSAGDGKHARQEAPHPHQIILDPAQRFVFVCDLGLNAVVVCESTARLREQLTPSIAAPAVVRASCSLTCC
jgi:6-phosphogluconolactonase (cycloisomerase 2 family)